MMKRLLCAALLALAFASCDKDPAGLLPESMPAGADSTATGRPTPPGIVVDHELVKYPTLGRLVPERLHGRIKTIRETRDGSFDTLVYHFREDGQFEGYEVTGKISNGDRYHRRTRYRYNDLGQLIERNEGDGNVVTYRIVYTYDATGNLARRVSYSRDGDTGPEREVGGASYVYDFSAMTYRATYAKVGTQVWSAAYAVGRFDGQGKVFESTSYHTDGYIVSKWTRTANSWDIEQMMSGTSIAIGVDNWTFTESGDLAQYTTTTTDLDKDSREVFSHISDTWTYTYVTKDQHGNWTKLIADLADRWTTVRTREITYY